MRTAAFTRDILSWFAAHGRAHLPWRKSRDPWRVLVSELMLQQTQVERVIPKYSAFLKAWPDAASLAKAPLGDVLAAWSGLGYNRRARFLWLAAQEVALLPGRQLPQSPDELEALPGIGPYTARAVLAFAFNADVTLWDTNVRRIFARYFWGGEYAAALPTDAELELALRKSLPRGRSRDWHGALMDFGSAICTARAPACGACPLRRGCVAAPRIAAGAQPVSALAPKQAAFKGSRREVRGMALKLLVKKGRVTREWLLASLSRLRPDAAQLLDQLIAERMVVEERGVVTLP